MAEYLRDPITLSRFILKEEAKHPGSEGDFTMLMASISLACKVISTAVRKAGLTGLYGLDGKENASGDAVKKLDVLSNDVFVNSLRFSPKISVMVSEEEEDAIIIATPTGKYCVCFDPLDGSSNIDCNVSVGSIFAIYTVKEVGAVHSLEDVLRPGNELVGAGYCMYGSSTALVYTSGDGVNGFTLDPSIGEFILTMPDIRIPEKPKTIYSINEGNSRYWDEATAAVIAEFKAAEPKPYSARYVGSMVTDVHRTLMYGGIFAYPADSKSTKGKLRLLYEANPMAFLVEQAGGRATDGRTRILDLVPEGIHCRTGIWVGCARDMDVVDRCFAAAGAEEEDEEDGKEEE